MHRIFKRHKSTPINQYPTPESSPEENTRRRRFTVAVPSPAATRTTSTNISWTTPSQFEYEVLYPRNYRRVNNTDDGSDNESVALSEGDTIVADYTQCLELQETYIENFTLYLPFIMRRVRNIEDRRLEGHEIFNGMRLHELNRPIVDLDPDDAPTIHEECPTDMPIQMNGARILDKNLSRYKLKRQLIMVEGILKHNTYIFPSRESFEFFKQLRSDIKESRRNSIIVYGPNGTIERIENHSHLSHSHSHEIPNINGTIDDRKHIIPMEYKIKGMGLPLLKMQSPMMSFFRKNTPYLLFKRYLEVPPPPPNPEDKKTEEDFETYTICTVQSKFFTSFRRFIFEFTFQSQPAFKIAVFQSNYRPFADFNYKHTRFRIIGPATTSGLMQEFNPLMRLLVLDDDQCSFTDTVYNKKSFGFSDLVKKSKKSGSSSLSSSSPSPSTSSTHISNQYQEFIESDPTTYINPMPRSELAAEDITIFAQPSSKFISSNLPPFGSCKEGFLYQDPNPHIMQIPKKFTEAGQIEMYQDDTFLTENPNSTLSIDADSIVLMCIFATMRYVSIQNLASNVNVSALSFMGRMESLRYSGITGNHSRGFTGI
ncbi:uncharacterized protein J8A68_004166 [[Candida] subhashii]|uniref:Uncharacterized protein n=1 Tax=[Candida] subhashii TaxID=561895 RepID=A0A8J5QKE6_9ASCO|nr:uncharacterized protein J8A68_004166 [[Candida] subhashii]KAG7662272.1 hypothetical protein J8A68_004166 [[Candida] subhashii]